MRFFYPLGVGLLTASLLLPQLAPGQTAPCPPAGIRTDPEVATNPGGRPNTFKWYYGDYQPSTYSGKYYKLNSPYPGVGQDYIEVPWLQPTNYNMDRFQGLIDTPADGWELIRRDLGYDDAGNPAKTTNPSVILYNRYTGMLRVFTAVGDLLAGYQFAEIKLTFSKAATNKAGTLNRQAALGVALEDTEPNTNPAFVAVARYLNGRSKWFVADFPMEYDPCICQFDSRLSVEVSLISQADVKLTGQTSGSLVSAGNGTSSSSSELDKGIPFIRKVNGALEAGGKSYDNIDKLTTSLAGKNPDKDAGLKWFADAAKKSNFLKDGLKALPYIGEAVSLLDFFMGGGKEAGPQPVVLQPMTIEMTTTTTGTITAPNLYNTTSFHNPGNRLSVSIPENVPYYNEAMGVFSLLKKPVLEYRSVVTSNFSDRSQNRANLFRLADNLQYVINPATGLEVQDFQAAIVLTGERDNAPTRPNPNASPGIPSSPSGDFPLREGPVAQANSSSLERYAYRTRYVDAACMGNSYLRPMSTALGQTPLEHTRLAIKWPT